jgi:hypothetical protein
LHDSTRGGWGTFFVLGICDLRRGQFLL